MVKPAICSLTVQYNAYASKFKRLPHISLGNSFEKWIAPKYWGAPYCLTEHCLQCVVCTLYILQWSEVRRNVFNIAFFTLIAFKRFSQD